MERYLSLRRLLFRHGLGAAEDGRRLAVAVPVRHADEHQHFRSGRERGALPGLVRRRHLPAGETLGLTRDRTRVRSLFLYANRWTPACLTIPIRRDRLRAQFHTLYSSREAEGPALRNLGNLVKQGANSGRHTVW